jgi:hypothetical protein
MSGESLYSSPDKRFYVHWCKQDSMFHIHDRRRHDWRVITPELSTAPGNLRPLLQGGPRWMTQAGRSSPRCSQ